MIMKQNILAGWISGLCSAVLFLISNTAFAGILMPINVGDVYTYNKYESTAPENHWSFYIEALEQVDVGTQEYIKIGTSNEHGTNDYDEALIRSTENAVYDVDGNIVFQTAPIGTTWSRPSYWDGLGSGVEVSKIISIESVTVPFGIFDNAYVHQVYFDPDDPLSSNTQYWYEYVVPDIGWVKQVDYTWTSNGPAISELTQITTVPTPSSILLYGTGLLFFSARRKRLPQRLSHS
jgi:hypothetical protein